MNTRESAVIVVREAAPADAEALARLMSEMDDEPAPGMGGERMKGVMAEMAAYPWFRAYLALDENRAPVGSFSLMIFSSPAHQGAPQALLDAVVVTRLRRGQGIGKAMLRHALRVAAERRCYKLALSSNLRREDAHRFYERIGFRQHGISFSIPVD